MIRPPLASRPRAFTLVETLITIGIIITLAALLLPSVTSMSEKAKRTKCLANLRQMSAGLIMHAAENDGYGPFDARDAGNTSLSSYRGGQSPIVFGPLLPYLDAQDYERYMVASGKPPEIFICPSSRQDLLLALRSPSCEATSYWMNPDVSSNPAKKTKLMSLPQRTIAMMDTCLWWQTTPEAWAPESHKAEGFNFIRLDGSAGWMSKKNSVGKSPGWDFTTLSTL
jgi:type II secretory pathway pseudopilin PulG